RIVRETAEHAVPIGEAMIDARVDGFGEILVDHVAGVVGAGSSARNVRRRKERQILDRYRIELRLRDHRPADIRKIAGMRQLVSRGRRYNARGLALNLP